MLFYYTFSIIRIEDHINFITEVYDEVIAVENEDAFETGRVLARKEGLLVGISSGAALSAAKKLIAKGVKGNIVIILPDRGDRYFSKHLYK